MGTGGIDFCTAFFLFRERNRSQFKFRHIQERVVGDRDTSGHEKKRDEKGEKKEGSEVELHGGWYGKGRDGNGENQSIRISQLEKNEEDKQKLTICAGLNFTQPRGIEELIIGDNSFNESCDDLSKMKMDLSEFKKLKRIEIGNDCLQHIREFVIDGLERLESVKIGKKCFYIDDNERDDGICRIRNCPNLRQLEIDKYSFWNFKSFEISHLNSIQSIKFGKYCFFYANCSLKGE